MLSCQGFVFQIGIVSSIIMIKFDLKFDKRYKILNVSKNK